LLRPESGQSLWTVSEERHSGAIVEKLAEHIVSSLDNLSVPGSVAA
jgi:hypothetical protein